jgi:hypothetical protein
MLSGIELALFLVLNLAHTATMMTLWKRHLHRTFTIRRRLGG